MYSNTSVKPSPVFAEVKNKAGPSGGLDFPVTTEVGCPAWGTSVAELRRDGVMVCADEFELEEVNLRLVEEVGDPVGMSNSFPLEVDCGFASWEPVVPSTTDVAAGLIDLYPESRMTSPSPTTSSELDAMACSTSGSQKMPSRNRPGVGGPESIKEEEAV